MADSGDTQFLFSPVESTDRTIGGNVLSIDNLYGVFDAVIDAAEKWYNIGLALNVREPTLRQIRANSRTLECTDYLREMLSHWLKNSESTTWQDVINALCSKSVKQIKIAEDIAQPRGLTLPVATTLKSRTFSIQEDVSQPTSIQQHSTSAPSDRDYMSFTGDEPRGLSREHRFPSAASMTSLYSPTHAGPSDFPHDLQWNTRPDIPALQKMSSPIDAAVHSDTAYFRPYRSRKIYSYNLTSGWSISADCLVRDASLVVLPVAYEGANHFHLHTIGGIKRKIHRPDEDEEEYTDAIYQLTDREWTCSIYPKLRTERSQVTVVFSNGCLIVAGGNSAHGIIQTVDVLDPDKKVWCEVSSLPYKVFRASGCVCNGILYILGGYVVREGDFVPTRNACVATVSELKKSHTDDCDIFMNIQNLDFKTSACVSFRNHVLAIGGWKFNTETGQQKGTKLVHVYHTDEDVWKELKGQLSRPRCFAFAAAFEDKIMIVGGYNRPDRICTDSVEFAIIPK